jgi:general secretion pathway protein A
MDQSNWGTRESPFRWGLDPKFFYQSPTHEEALARLDFLVEQHRRLGLLTGPGGSGKSLILEVFAEQLLRGTTARQADPAGYGYPQVAKLSLLDVEPDEMLWLLATEWKVGVEPTDSTSALWRAVTDRLKEFRYQQWPAVALLDDADQADPRVLQHIARLVRFDPSPEMRLTVVMAGRNEGMATLDPSLMDLVQLRIDVEPWQRADTEQYIRTSLAQLGRQWPAFADSAVDRLHELARGIPRRAAQLADLALLAAAGQNLPQIDAATVETVCQELA